MAGALTPVPGGVGPITVAMVLRNTVTAAELRLPERRRCDSQDWAHGRDCHGKELRRQQDQGSRCADGGCRRAVARGGGARHAGPCRGASALRSRRRQARRHHGSRAHRADRVQRQACAPRSRSDHPPSGQKAIDEFFADAAQAHAISPWPTSRCCSRPAATTSSTRWWSWPARASCSCSGLMERNKLSKEDAERRLNAQLPIDQKVKKATHVIRTEARSKNGRSGARL